MAKPVVKVEVKAVLPTSGGCAVFLGNDDKSFVIYIDHGVGAAITMAMRQIPQERPLTHALIGSILLGVGAKVERVVINDMDGGVFYARLIISVENELHERKVIEIDARPSDSLALATQAKAPVFVSESVWEAVEDMSEMLRKMKASGLEALDEPGQEPPPTFL
jgi:hypothetical protein